MSHPRSARYTLSLFTTSPPSSQGPLPVTSRSRWSQTTSVFSPGGSRTLKGCLRWGSTYSTFPIHVFAHAEVVCWLTERPLRLIHTQTHCKTSGWTQDLRLTKTSLWHHDLDQSNEEVPQWVPASRNCPLLHWHLRTRPSTPVWPATSLLINVNRLSFQAARRVDAICLAYQATAMLSRTATSA